MSRPRLGDRAVAGAGAVLVSLLLCAPAAGHWPTDGHIYWANETGNTIGRADADGTNVDQDFIIGATAPRGVVVDGAHVYWTHDLDGGKIGRAGLDGVTGLNQSFLTVGSSPQGIARDAKRLYWANTAGSPAGPKIGAANADETGTGQNNAFASAGSSPCGVAHSVDKIYFANGGSPGSLGRVHGSFPDPSWSIAGPATNDPCGVAE